MQDQLALRVTLTRTDHPVVKLLDGDDIRKISARNALLAAHGGDYEYGGSRNRVRWMRPVKQAHPWASCWRTMQAAVLPPAPEYWLGVR